MEERFVRGLLFPLLCLLPFIQAVMKSNVQDSYASTNSPFVTSGNAKLHFSNLKNGLSLRLLAALRCVLRFNIQVVAAPTRTPRRLPSGIRQPPLRPSLLAAIPSFRLVSGANGSLRSSMRPLRSPTSWCPSRRWWRTSRSKKTSTHT